MRLTSYNIALVRLNAGCCLSEMVERMWRYMEEGDTENADCVREKALMLSALIKTLCRWRPTIAEGLRSQLLIDISGVTHPEPFLVDSISANGVKIVPRFIAFDGTPTVVSGQVCAGNGYISPDDDTIQARFTRLEEEVFTIDILSTFTFDNIEGVTSGGASGTGSITAVIDNVPFNSVQPRCLTNAQVLSIVRKIDELCECNC